MGFRPVFYMLCGVPAAGKSTWVKNAIENGFLNQDAFIYSTDSYIEELAVQRQTTYNELFNDGITYKRAVEIMDRGLISAIDRRANIVWDQTNLTPKSRKSKINRIPNVYKKFVINFDVPEETIWQDRLNSRPGKVIPPRILLSMVDSWSPATKDEGFNWCFNVYSDTQELLSKL
jgi:predicted kinase